MRLKFLSAVSLAIAGIICGCTSESPVDTSRRDGEMGFTSFSISVKNSISRAESTSSQTDWADDVEKTINNVDIYIFKEGKLETSIRPQIDEGGVSTPVAVELGVKTIYAIANSPFELVKEDGMDMANFEAKLYNALKNSIAVSGRFTMIGKTTHTVLARTEEDAKNNPARIGVSRSSAKLQVKYDAEEVTVNNSIAATLTDVMFGATQCPKEMYITLGEKYTPIGERPATGGTYPGLWVPDSYDNSFFKSALPAFTADYAKSDYLGESKVQNPTTGKVPFIMVRMKVTPDAIFGGKTLTEDGTFTVLARHDAATASWVYATDASYNILYFANEADATAYAAEYSVTNYEAYTYTSGYAYYRINLKTDSEAESLSDKYCVLRNHFYMVNITEVKGLGAPTGPGVIPTDPEEPLEAEAWLTATIEIDDWVEVANDATLQ